MARFNKGRERQVVAGRWAASSEEAVQAHGEPRLYANAACYENTTTTREAWMDYGGCGGVVLQFCQ